MSSALNHARYFFENNIDVQRNSFDGNMKLQKLLFFASLISLARYGRILFDEPIRAFEKGCVVEEVRKKYKNDFYDFKKGLIGDISEISEEEKSILDITLGIYGHLSAKELSELNHDFCSWKAAYPKSLDASGYKDPDKAVISHADLMTEAKSLIPVIDLYIDNQARGYKTETIYGITFYYNPQETILNEEDISELANFAFWLSDDDEKTYTVYRDECGKLVVF